MMLLFLLLFAHLINSEENIRHVHVIYRHGDRTPSKLFYDHTKTSKKWTSKYGELTNIGIKQHFELGKWLRIRYKSFLSPKYNSSEIYVQSTNLSRTMMSAQSNLAGLYYNGKDNFISGLSWRPIPIHIVSRISDSLTHPKKCNMYKKKVEEMFQTEAFQSLFSEYKETLNIMRKVTGNENLKYEESLHLFDGFFCEKINNMTLDSWVTEDVYKNMSLIFSTTWKMMYYGEELAKLSGGRLLDKIINKLKNISQEGKERSNKMNMISGHDADLAALLSAIGIYDGVRPPYSACVMIELIHKPIGDTDLYKDWVIKIFYKTSLTDSPTEIPEMTLSCCKSHPCSLGDFIKCVRPRTIDLESYQRMCPLSDHDVLHMYM